MIGYLIGKYPFVFLISTFAFLAPLLSFFLIYPIEIETDVRRGFAHRNGRSIEEFKAFGAFYNMSMKDMELLVVLIESKDQGISRLPMSAKLLAEVERLDNWISELHVPIAGDKNLTFKEIQSARGNVNFLFYAFKFGFDWQQSLLDSNSTLDGNIELDYPKSSIFGHNISIECHFFGVERYSLKKPRNKISQIKSTRTIILWYMFQANSKQRKYLRDMEIEVFEKSQKNFSDQFEFHVYGDELINNEMMKGSERTVKLLAVGLAIMIVFMAIALRDFSIKQAILLTISSIGSPMLAIAATFALLGWLNRPFNSMMAISPFLVLGIGVDDAFLLIHSWRKHSKLNNDPVKTMETVIRDAGPSISITSVTNVLAFSLGILSPANQLSSFCLCTSVAVALDYLFEFTVFASCLALCTRFKQPKRTVIQEKNEMWSRYASFLLAPFGRFACLLTLVMLITFSFFGIRSMETDFDPQKLFPADSHLQHAIRPLNQLYNDYKPISLICHKAPENFTELAEFMNMVKKIESLPGALPNSSELWLRDYINYDYQNYIKKNVTSSYLLTYENVPNFLSDRLMSDKNIVLYHRENQSSRIIIDKFIFVLVFSGNKSWHQRAHHIEDIRNIIDEYHQQFNVTVFDYDGTIFDLILTVKSEMIKAVLVTLACMSVVCFLFIPNFKYIAISMLSVLSISFNLLGFLGWWGNDFDPVTLINVLMSVGFAVDFSAHIIYHHWHTKRNEQLLGIDSSKTEHQRLVIALSNIGRPMIEAALSTIICMLPLFWIRIYVITSFAKTVLGIGLIGLFHGLFVLPVFMSFTFTPIKSRNQEQNRSQSNGSDTPLI